MRSPLRQASWMKVKRLLPGVSAPLFHATNGPRGALIGLRGQGLKADSGFSHYGGQSGISMSRDLGFLLRGGFGNVIFVFDGSQLRQKFGMAPAQHPSVGDEFEERVDADKIPASMIRGVVFAGRAPQRFVLKEWAQKVPYPVLYQPKAGKWEAASDLMLAKTSSKRVALRYAFVVKSISQLLRYLQKEDWEKVFEVVQERDREGDAERFGDWIIEHYGPGGRGSGKSKDPLVQQVLEDPGQFLSLYPTDFQKQTYQDYFKYGDWEDQSWYQRDHEAPSWFNLTNPSLAKNQWLIHFTMDADQIADGGFRYGQSDLSRLGGHVSNALDARRSSGKFNFGYNAKDQAQYEKGHGKYGYEAVLFKASGVEAWHSGDQERQVIFAGNTAKDIIPLTSSDWGSGWLVGGLGKGGRPDGDGDAFPSLVEAVEWAKKNYGQYKNVMSRRAAQMALLGVDSR